ncbi:MAG: glycosyl hydrolase family 95 catalytic domain-containing protein [Fimbriimonadaceae bacterium]
MIALLGTLTLTPPSLGPAPTSNLQLSAPIKTWDEAAPLGNGVMGALLWGEGNLIKVSLDRGDIWDLREQGLTVSPAWTYAHLQDLIKAKNQAEIVHLFDSPYDAANPTKLPGIRLELTLDPRYAVRDFSLDLSEGIGRFSGEHGDGSFVIDRANPVLLGRVTAPVEKVRLAASQAVLKLGFAAPVYGNEKYGEWAEQKASKGLVYAAYAATHTVKGVTEIAVAFATNAHNADALKEARRMATEALRRGYRRIEQATRTWWQGFWAVSGVRVPDAKIQAQYDLAMYLYGAGGRDGSPPIGLQGLWTADDGGLPPWKGDYHHDLNTELTYWPYLTSGHWEQGRGLLDFLWHQLPRYEEFADEFYAAPGAAIPGVAALDGSPLGGWPMYSLSPSMGLWIAMAFIDYWRYSRDAKFLKARAYPFCRELAVCARTQLRPGLDGKLRLPTSSSPEIHDNSLGAWLTPNSNFDLAVLKAFFTGMGQMAAALNRTADAKSWKDIIGKLEEFHISTVDGGLAIDATQDLEESHRHFSHITAIHPFGLINVEGGSVDRKVIDASLARLKKLGTSAWCGYSFAWMACIQARCLHPNEALRDLSIYANAFVLRNGFHANGDQSGKGYSNFTYRPVTLEGNFAAAQAVQEMVLQSWGGKVRVFPAVPSSWADVSFTGLRAEGGFIVSAERRAGKTVRVVVTATLPATLSLQTDARLTWKTPAGVAAGAQFTVNLRPGQQVVGS